MSSFCGSTLLLGQDTLLIKPDVVGVGVLTPRVQRDRIPRSNLATGENLELDLTPQSVYIITSEDILRQNISTLTDVMRLVPGAVISAVGNADEGEKFMMNGLSGNAHVKVMINNVPVKPWTMSGMPIGAQLPIRQADRIEVMIGSASAFLGEEACAGVINIILEESERPVFTRTNLGFGQLGYNDLDLTFGGKIGKDRNIFRFTVYGRSTVQNNRDIFYNKAELFDYRKYLLYPNLTPIWERNANLFPDNTRRDTLVPIFGAPHESRQFGVMLLWRGIRFRYDLMSRRDYSSIGLNPMAVGYWRPGDRIGDRIETFSIQLGRTKTRRQSNFMLSVLRSSSTQNSLKTHVFGAMGQTFFQDLRRDFLPNYNEKLYNRLSDTYFNGQRNVVNQGLDTRLSYRMSWSLKRGFTYTAGFHNSVSLGTHYSDLLNKPLFSSNFLPFPDTSVQVKPFKPAPTLTGIANVYQQLMYRRNGLTLLAGVSGHLILDYGIFRRHRLAALWKVSHLLSFDAHYGEGYTPASPYYSGNTVILARNESETYQMSFLNTDTIFLKPQFSRSYEFGVRAREGRLSGRAAFIGMNLQNTIEGGYTERGSDRYNIIGDYVLYGYKNDFGSRTEINAFRLEARLDSASFELPVRSKMRDWQWSQMASFQLSTGRRIGIADSMGVRKTLDYVPNYPGWNAKYVSSFVNQKLDISLIVQWQADTRTHLELYQDRFPLLAGRTNLAAGRRTVDLSARLFVNKNFSAWIDIRNLFGRVYYGIDASGTPDDLVLNPQALGGFRFGVQYNLD
jgi:TonB-dependent Receptor Plug Domain